MGKIRRWGGARSWQSQLRGLETRYDNGTMSRAALVAAYRRYAADMDELVATTVLSRTTGAGWARSCRKKADALEQASEEERR